MQNKKQNSIMEVYVRFFVNFKSNNSDKFLPITKIAYINGQNTSINYESIKRN